MKILKWTKMIKNWTIRNLFLSFFFLLSLNATEKALAARNNIKNRTFRNSKLESLSFEVLNDQTVHFVYSSEQDSNSEQNKITDINFATLFEPSPYIAQNDETKTYQANYQGPTSSSFKQTISTLETSELKISVDLHSLCFSLFSVQQATQLTQVCPLGSISKGQTQGLSLKQNKTKHIYGLGEQFLPNRLGQTDGDWMGQIRTPGNSTGNAMVNYPPNKSAWGAVGNAQFPILYATDDQSLNFSLFVDEVRPITWDFTKPLWQIGFQDKKIKGFLTVATQLSQLRTAYMDLVGHPLVPPKKAFGLWVSQYGFNSWNEIDNKLSSLRQNHFPVDGFVLDLQWFGNVTPKSEFSRMGTLEFDESPSHFPNPREKIDFYKREQGIGLITIEESYVAQGLKEAKDLAVREMLVTKTADRNLSPENAQKNAFYLNTNPWWGLGGMIDWTNPAAGTYWHNLKRQPLIDLGIIGHWIDLGEPELFQNIDQNSKNPNLTTPFYAAGDQAQAQNIFSLKWQESIYRGYNSAGNLQRPFMLSRSGGSGSQRYGAAMWSGDIGSKMANFATHLNVQTQMSLSGMDYFGADIGGFHREDLDGDLNELYTKWFAGASFYDVPVRPHVQIVKESDETAPDRVGDLQSNLANIRLRYELSPYYYSLAHLAYEKGEPVMPPVFYYYPSPKTAATQLDIGSLAGQKLIGKDLLTASISKFGTTQTNLYFPAGTWTDYHQLNEIQSIGQVVKGYSAQEKNIFKLPLFARAGAIIPKMWVDDLTLNILGKRADGVTHTELIAKVFPSPSKSKFTLYEDDGVTNEYTKGKVAKTTLTQQQFGPIYLVNIEATLGQYELEDPNTGRRLASPQKRKNQIELVMPASLILNSQVFNQLTVWVNGKPLQKLLSWQDFLKADSGFYIKDKRVVLAKSTALSVSVAKKFIFDFRSGQ